MKNDKNNYFELLFLLFCFVFTPSFLSYLGLNFYYNQSFIIQLNEKERNLVNHANEISTRLDQRYFWYRHLRSIFRNSSSVDDFKIGLQKLLDSESIDHQFALWDKNSKLKHSNFIDLMPQKDQQHWLALATNLSLLHYEKDPDKRLNAFNSIRKALGKNFFIIDFVRFSHNIQPRIYTFELTPSPPKIFVARNNRFMAVIQLSMDNITPVAVVNRYFKSNKTPDFSLLSGSTITEGTYRNSANIAGALSHFSKHPEDSTYLIADRLYSLLKIDAQNQVLLSKQINKTQGNLSVIVFLTAIISGLLFRVIIKNNSGISGLAGFSIARLTFILTLVSAGIPTLIVIIGAMNYYSQRQTLLINEKTQDMHAYLQRIDKGFITQLAYSATIIERRANELTDIIKANEPDDVPHTVINNWFKHSGYQDFLIASNERQRLFNPGGYAQFENNRLVKMNFKFREPDKDQFTAMWPLARRYIALANDCEKGADMPDEAALFVETFFQKPIDSILADFHSRDQLITHFSFGTSYLYSYLQLLKLGSSNQFDSFIILSFIDQMLNRAYAMRVIETLQNNPHGARIFMGIGQTVWPKRTRIVPENEMYELHAMAPGFQSSEPILVEYNNRQWIYSGLECKFIDNMRLWALYPVDDIHSQIDTERKQLITIAVIALLMVFSLGFVFNFNLIYPVAQLNLAAEALKKHNYNFRVSKLEDHEFNEMGHLFNKSIEDFEELKIAGMVQNRLFPHYSLEIPNISVYAKTIFMTDMGGDYYDYFEVDDEHIGLLAGNVAGHGVGASLIMAMVKAGVMCAKEKLLDPAETIRDLHKIVMASKSKKQRKMMTFQYALIDHNDGSGIYSNAGACNPLIVNKDGQVKELVSIGPPLGSFKKASFSSIKFKIEKGDAMVFYTDGIIEAHNSSGEILGYDRFKELLAKSFEPCAKKYYENVYQGYLNWTNASDAEDDMTILIMTYMD